MAGVLPATIRIASRSKIAPGDFVNSRGKLQISPRIPKTKSRHPLSREGGDFSFEILVGVRRFERARNYVEVFGVSGESIEWAPASRIRILSVN